MAKKEMVVPVIPETEKRANSLIQEIRAHQRAKAKVEQLYADATKEYREESSLIQLGILRRFLGLFIFYQKNRETLTEGGKTKIATLVSGKIGAYLSSSPEVETKKPKRIIALIKAKGKKFAKRFLREKTIVNLDKDAMKKYSEELLADPEIAKLVKMIEKEYFKVEPIGGETVSEDVKKLEKLI